jgi:hypothetical protein
MGAHEPVDARSFYPRIGPVPLLTEDFLVHLGNIPLNETLGAGHAPEQVDTGLSKTLHKELEMFLALVDISPSGPNPLLFDPGIEV